MKADVEAGWISLDAKGKLRLFNGSHIPNTPNAPTMGERVKRYYAEKQSQYIANEEDEDDDTLYIADSPSLHPYASQYSYIEDLIDPVVCLECKFDLEEKAELSQFELERVERYIEKMYLWNFCLYTPMVPNTQFINLKLRSWVKSSGKKGSQ